MAKGPTRKERLRITLNLARKWARGIGYPRAVITTGAAVKGGESRWIYSDDGRFDLLGIVIGQQASNGEWCARVVDQRRTNEASKGE